MVSKLPKQIGKVLLVLCVMALIAGTAVAATNVTLTIDGSTTVYPVVQVSQTRFPVTFPDTNLSRSRADLYPEWAGGHWHVVFCL